jgi:diaminopimelate epimerase
VKFTKMHGLGNDFIFVFEGAERLSDPAGAAVRLCRRRFGVGADGLVLLGPSKLGDAAMHIFNADGSESPVCGNALRCAARYLVDRKVVPGPELAIESGGSVKRARVLPDGNVRVDMGEPILDSAAVPVTGEPRRVVGEAIEAGGEQFLYSAVSMGNPHCVIFLEAGREAPVEKFGPLLEGHPLFPERTNVEFCRVINSAAVEVAVWERGAGRTLACGTGACAVVVAGALQGILDRAAAVHLSGGVLKIEWSPAGPVYMEGPAEEVYTGDISGGRFF